MPGRALWQKNSNLDHDSPAVQKHLDILQSIIQRLAENSRSCKLWCITLVSATLVLVARTGEPLYTLTALAPAALLWILDAYYLALERGFRKSYNAFVRKIHRSELCVTDLYKVFSGSEERGQFLWAMFQSFSTYLFYPAIAIIIVLVCLLIWLFKM